RGQIGVFTDEFEVWQRSGYESGPLGMPTSGRQCPTTSYCFQIFEGGPVTNHSIAGVHYVTNEMWQAWGRYGYESGQLGYPAEDPQCVSAGCIQRFQGGHLSASASHGAHLVPDALASAWRSLGGIGTAGIAVADANC